MDRITLSARIEAADLAERRISGRIVTYGEEANAALAGKPTRIVFSPGSIEIPEDAGSIRFQLEHDNTKPLGRAVSFSETEDGQAIDASFRVVATQRGDDALLEASEQLRDGLSVGVDVIKGKRTDGVYVIESARLHEVSLVTYPAIASAKVTDVAAAEAEEEQTEAAPAIVPIPKEETMNQSEAVEASASAVLPTANVPAPIRSAARTVSAGEYVAAAATRLRDSSAWERVTAALDEQILSENPGIVPEPIVGSVVDTALASRPFVQAFPRMAMPSAGKQYTRPVITQHTSVAAQAAELDELSSQLMTITGIPVTKGTYGGALRLSVQDRDFTDPAILQIIINDMAKQYAKATDAAACTAFTGGVTQTEALAANATADAVLAAIYGAAEQVVAGVNELPNLLIASPDQWSRLGSLVDTTKRAIFPSLAPMNAGGSMAANSFSANPIGLNLVVDANLASGTLIVGNSNFFEIHEQTGGQLSVEVPSILGVDLAFYGYFSTVMLEADAFVSLEPAA